jgi:Do/DeqQ family serine protease
MVRRLRHEAWFEPARVGGPRIATLAMALAIGLSLTLTACRRHSPQIMVQSSPVPRQVGRATSYADAITNVAPSVVSVYTRTELHGKSAAALAENPALRRLFADKGKPTTPGDAKEVDSLGSGVLVSQDGYILTDNHVVQGADSIIVATASGDQYKAQVVGTDPATDIAVLKIDAKNLPAAVLADSSQLRVGDIVLAIGNPFGVGQTVTSGIVSATERSNLGIAEYEDFIQTDAAINPGNSGGALVDAQGRVIGINTVILSSGGGFEGIGLAIPINLAREVMSQLITTGKVVRGYLGVSLHPLTAELGKMFEVSPNQGALVVDVQPESPASRAGLRAGDIIIELNGKPSGSSRRLRVLIAGTAPGTQARLKVRRLGGHDKTLTATVAESPPTTPKVQRRAEATP